MSWSILVRQVRRRPRRGAGRFPPRLALRRARGSLALAAAPSREARRVVAAREQMPYGGCH
jgi:hypothetical protein